jgi:threonine synthase
MKFLSTREKNQNFVNSAEAIKEGLAPDGGLYLPESIPSLSIDEICALADLPG